MSSISDTPLSKIKELLEDLDYFVFHEPVNQDNPVEKIFISLDVEEENSRRQYIIEWLFVNDVIQAFGGDDDEDDAVISQCTLILPIVIPEKVNHEILRLCGLVNRMVPLGSFGLSEADQAVYLRYCLASDTRMITDTVALQIVSVFEYLCREYMPVFQRVCDQTYTTQAFIDSFEKSGHSIPSVGNPALLAGDTEQVS